MGRYRSKGDVELHGLTKTGKPAKKPFAYITVAQNEMLAEMQAAGFSLDDMILCTKHTDSELYDILTTYKERGWEKAASFGYSYYKKMTGKEQEEHAPATWWIIVQSPVLTDEEIDSWREILQQWKRYENSW